MDGIRLGKVIAASQPDMTIDVLLVNGGGVVRNIGISSLIASTTGGIFELPYLKTVSNTQKNIYDTNSQQSVATPNLYEFENNVLGKTDLDDPTTNYAYALIAMVDKSVGKNQPICLGFWTPVRNQVLFNPNLAPQNATAAAKAELPKFVGAYLHRTNSDVYNYTDSDGNMELFHPNGSFIRMAETPTIADNGVIHVDLTGANANAETIENGEYTGNPLTTAWNVSRQVGVDGNLNSDRKLYFHLEIVTEAGHVIIDIDKVTGNISFQTPGSTTNTADGNNNILLTAGNYVNIVATDSDVNVTSSNGNINITSNVGGINELCDEDIDLTTNSGDINLTANSGEAKIESNSILLAATEGVNVSGQSVSFSSPSIILSTSGATTDSLVLLSKLIEKFNTHTHICAANGQPSAIPNQQFSVSDGTTTVKAS